MKALIKTIISTIKNYPGNYFITFLFIFMVIYTPTPCFPTDKPLIFVQKGHSGSINAIAVSPDGRYVVSGSNDDTLILWDIIKEREIRTLKGHEAYISSVTFSPNGRYILSGSDDNTLKLWEVTTGRLVRTFKKHGTEGINTGVTCVAFSPDGKYALSGARSTNTIKIWNVQTGEEVRVLSGHKKCVKSIVFTPDGRYMLTGSNDKTVKLWKTSTWQVIRVYRQGTCNRCFIESVDFSPDGKHILSASLHKVIIWNMSTGEQVKTIRENKTWIQSTVFSPDGKYILFGNRSGKLKLWSVSTGKKIRVFDSGREDSINSVAYAQDGRYIMSGSHRSQLIVWNAATGEELKRLTGFAKEIECVAVSPNGHYALSGSRDATVKVWDLHLGSQARLLKGAGSVNSAAFSPNSSYILAGSFGMAELFDIRTGRKTKTYRLNKQTDKYQDEVQALAFSPYGKYILGLTRCWYSGKDEQPDMARIFDINTTKEIWSKKVRVNNFKSTAFSPDGRYILLPNCFEIKLYNTQTGTEIRTFSGHTNWVNSIKFSPDSRYVLSGSDDGSIRLWKTSSGEEIKKFFITSSHSIKSVAYSQCGRYGLAGYWDGAVRLWSISQGTCLKTFHHSKSVNSVAFIPGTKYAITGSEDKTTRIWNIATGKEIVRMIGITNGEWIIMTPEGYYASSLKGDSYLNVRVRNRVYGIDQWHSTFYKPQVIEAALRLGDSQKAIAEALGKGKEKTTVATMQNIEPPFVIIKTPEDGEKIGSTNTSLSVYIEDRKRPIKKVKVYVNGRLVVGKKDRAIKVVSKLGGVVFDAKGINIPEGRRSLDLKIPIELEKGENLIEVLAFNGFSEERKSIRVYSLYKKAAAKEGVILPNLWILSIGINKYQDKQLDSLSYAVADAEGIVRAFERQKGLLFREVHSLIISDKSSVKPTSDNIEDNLNYLSRAGQNDIVLLFIAGHGMNDDRGEFYFLPCDAVIRDDGSIRRSRAISWRDLKATLDLPAKKLIFADTCHSEGLSGKKTRGVDNDRFVKELQEANAVIFTSSRGRELSQEDDKWGHGAFTYALIEGLKGEADLFPKGGDNKISMKELDTYVSETVPQITNGAQHPITSTPDGYVNFPVALIK